MIDWYRLARPNMWSRNYPTSEEWDVLLNYLLDNHSLSLSGDCTASLGPVEVWVSNYPYAYGQPYRPVSIEVMPKGATLARLRRVEEQARRIKGSAPMNRLRDIVLGGEGGRT